MQIYSSYILYLNLLLQNLCQPGFDKRAGLLIILMNYNVLPTWRINSIKYGLCTQVIGLRPYHAESTGSRPITEVKPRRAWLVLGWATALEPQVL